MDSENLTEGFGGEGGGGGGWGSPVMGIKEGTYCNEHWCYWQTMNHGTLHQKLMIYCMVTNIT